MGVKYGLCNAHYAKILNTGGYAAPKRLAGAENLTLNDHADFRILRAAGIDYPAATAGSYKSGELGIASLPLSFLTEIMGYRNNNGVLIEMQTHSEHFALLFESLNSGYPERFVYYDCMAIAPEFERETTGDSVKVVTEKLSIVATRPLARLLRGWNADYKAQVSFGHQAFDTWFDEVYVQ